MGVTAARNDHDFCWEPDMGDLNPLAERDRFWMSRALELAAQAADQGEVPVGAVVVLDDRELGSGFNRPIGAADPTAHAEIQALRAAARAQGNYRLTGATLYVTIEPCTMCAGALVHARIARLVFGAREPKAGAVRSCRRLLEHPEFNWQVSVDEGILAPDCAKLMSTFFAMRRGPVEGGGQAPPAQG